jgi:hypothetical protein
MNKDPTNGKKKAKRKLRRTVRILEKKNPQ